MLVESFVAVMAMIAACVLKPGNILSVNSPAGIVGKTPAAGRGHHFRLGIPGNRRRTCRSGDESGRGHTLQSHGRRAVARVGMAHIFSGPGRRGDGNLVSLRHHVEALFILTILDAGTRVGRFLLQDLMGHFWKPLSKTSWYPGIILSSAIMVAAWGYFLFQGVMDPLGGINSLWPLFGISNQLLAAIALCVCTTILIKMGKSRYILVTLAPLVWLVSATMTASAQKIWAPDPALGFLAHARYLAEQIAGRNYRGDKIADTQRLIFNDRIGRHGHARVCLGGFGDPGRIRSKLVALLFRKEASRSERVRRSNCRGLIA